MPMTRGSLIEALTGDFTEPLRDPLWGTIHMSPAMKALASSPPFAKLVGIRQLGPAFLVYPGATHTRHAHSLGVFHAARRLALALAEKGGLEFASPEGLASFLAAALCHDLGHFPFAHSLKELELASHEALGADLVCAPPLADPIHAAGADPVMVAAIMDHGRPGPAGRELTLYRGMLSGVLDPDKLDYLSRDAWSCGVPYGVQDAEYILQRVRLVPGDRVGVDSKGLMSVEGLLFAKYLMYRSVYWHAGVRAATSMVKKAVWSGMREGALRAEELYGLDDAGFIRLVSTRDFEAARLARSVFDLQPWRLVLDLPFDPEAHASLLDLDSRAETEAALAAEAGLGPLEVVIDIPEPISFETDLPVADGEAGEVVAFPESTTVFSPPVVEGFTRCLRRLRVFAADPEPRLVAVARAFLDRRDCEKKEKVYTRTVGEGPAR